MIWPDKDKRKRDLILTNWTYTEEKASQLIIISATHCIQTITKKEEHSTKKHRNTKRKHIISSHKILKTLMIIMNDLTEDTLIMKARESMVIFRKDIMVIHINSRWTTRKIHLQTFTWMKSTDFLFDQTNKETHITVNSISIFFLPLLSVTKSTSIRIRR